MFWATYNSANEPTKKRKKTEISWKRKWKNRSNTLHFGKRADAKTYRKQEKNLRKSNGRVSFSVLLFVFSK